MTILLLLVVVSTSSSTLIPVTFVPYSMPGFSESPRTGGLPIIDAEHFYGPMRPYVVHLGTEGTSAIPEQAMIHGSSISQLRIPNANGSMIEISDLRHQQMHIFRTQRNRGIDRSSDGRHSTVGIGTGSDLLRFGGPIDFVRQNTTRGFLRLGGSEDNFITNDCLPDSVMRMATVIGRTISGHPQVETRVSVSIGENVRTADSVSIMDSEGFLLAMPHSWVEDIHEALLWSQVRFRYSTVFRDCANQIQSLPNITLTFSAGGLLLVPEDYTRPTGQHDTCELLVKGTNDDSLRFNPLMISGINARSTENEIILCDSAINL